MTDDDNYKVAMKALKQKVHTDEVWDKLIAKINAPDTSRQEAGYLIDGLEHGMLFTGSDLPRGQAEIVFAFLQEHAPKEFDALKNALAADGFGLPIQEEQEEKAKFSELVKESRSDGGQSRGGKRTDPRTPPTQPTSK